MRYMAVITTLFMPLTFITGFFGMNFFQPAFQGQTWTSEIVLLVTLVGMILFPVLMWWWLKRDDSLSSADVVVAEAQRFDVKPVWTSAYSTRISIQRV